MDGRGWKRGRGWLLMLHPGADVEECGEEGGGGAVLMCISELQTESEMKRGKKITIGFLVKMTETQYCVNC